MRKNGLVALKVLESHLPLISQDSINGSTGTAPGADDDASGIASITEIIRAAMAKGYRPTRTVKFMGYAAQVALNGGCWVELEREKCEALNLNGYMYKNTCYVPVLPPERPPTSQPVRQQ